MAWKDVVVGDPLCCLSGVQVGSISQAKSLANGVLVTIADKKVTAGTNEFGDRFYIEEDDRSSGIQVYLGRSFPGITEGAVVTVRGILAVRDGERVIDNASVIVAGAPGRSSSAAAIPSVKPSVKPKLYVRRL